MRRTYRFLFLVSCILVISPIGLWAYSQLTPSDSSTFPTYSAARNPVSDGQQLADTYLIHLNVGNLPAGDTGTTELDNARRLESIKLAAEAAVLQKQIELMGSQKSETRAGLEQSIATLTEIKDRRPIDVEQGVVK